MIQCVGRGRGGAVDNETRLPVRFPWLGSFRLFVVRRQSSVVSASASASLTSTPTACRLLSIATSAHTFYTTTDQHPSEGARTNYE